MNYRIERLWVGLGGLGVGAVLGSGVARRWGADIGTVITSANFVALLSGLGGAVVGGLISYFIAKQSSRETAARENETMLANEQTQALSCMVTTMQISNRFFTLNKGLKVAATPCVGSQPWQLLQASTGSGSPPLRYTPKEFTPFIKAKSAPVVHRALLLAERLDALEAGFAEYSKRRIELEQFLLPMSSFSSGAMSSAIPPHLHTPAKYRMETLNRLILQMAEFCERDLADSQALIEELNSAFTAYFGHRANFRLEAADR
ncbi:hypothetical protein [Mesorhizobium sp. Root172]|uniref:hypothetical protein n=1 Tax=Mesorhizobium sp. Root172 TaxID=1736481 RepID=UPI0006F2DD54|nr:hypothetical protein [Mesorhizobium sp. Root172]KRB26318.1 hypothetical protein ASE05_10450 [Mesorhizobium sp. Root172]